MTAEVQSAAIYGATGLIALSELIVTDAGDAAIDATADAAIQAVAYFGDATGNGDYSGLDAQRVARVAVGLDNGFAAYPYIDPVIITDADGSGTGTGPKCAAMPRIGVPRSGVLKPTISSVTS